MSSRAHIASSSGSGGLLPPELLRQLSSCRIIAERVLETMQHSGIHAGRIHGPGRDFAQYRPYSPGDDLRQLDWHLMARNDGLFCRIQTPENACRVLFLIDDSASMDYCGGEAGISKFRFASIIAAVLAAIAKSQGDHIALAFTASGRSYGGNEEPSLDAFCHLLDHARCVPSGRDGLPPEIPAADAPPSSASFWLSDFIGITPDCLARSLRTMRLGGNRCHAIQITDHDELTLPFLEAAAFEDPEDGRQTIAEPSRVRNEYLDNLGDFLREIRQCCLDCQATYTLLDTSESPAGAIEALLRPG